MEKAIRKSIEGGYYPNTGERTYIETRVLDIDKKRVAELLWKESFYNPLFWQALSRSEGWQEANVLGFKPTPEGREVWKEHWHSFIDHLAEGKDIDSFFNELLK